jgi:hypothetical protein
MSFLDYDLQNVPELEVLPEGEYELRILACEVKTSQAGNPMVSLSLDCPAEPNSKGIHHTIMLPTDADDEKKRNGRLRSLKGFCEAFGINTVGGITLDDSVVGNTGWAIIAIESSPEYGDQNRVRRFVTGN